ncbi:MAG: VCBS repeat-containing protein, partial [Kiritimatiellae bacterium]|nr:VCBS repeat-containing protein [Kiritimatiellia bacterium]
WTLTAYPADYAGPTSGTGDLASTAAPSGDYTAQYGALSGYTTPGNQTQAVTDGTPTSFTGTYTRDDGTIAIVVAPDTGIWTFTAYPADYAGPTSGTGNLAAAAAPTGDYTLQYGALSGYTAPANQTRTVQKDTWTSFLGAYTRHVGTITVDVTPDTGSWTLTAHPADYTGPTSGTGDLASTAAPSGDYTVQYGALTGYTTPGSQTQAVTDGMPTAFTGNYTIITYLITATAGSGGSITPAGNVSVEHGSSRTFTITADPHYHVSGVRVDGVSVGAVPSYTFVNVVAGHAIDATFAIDLHTLDVISAWGTPAPAAGTHVYDYGSVLDCAVLDSPLVDGGTQHVCVGWTGTGAIPATGTATNTGPVTLTQNSRVSWQWQVRYRLETAAGAGGSIVDASGWYEAGSNVSVSATASSGHHFVQWTGDVPGGSETSNPLALTLDQARSVTASFARDVGTITVDVTPDSGGWTLTAYPADYAGATSGTGDLGATPAPSGDYTVQYGPLAGYVAPPPQTLPVAHGATAAFSGAYSRRMGALAVNVTPDGGSWRITAYPADYAGPRSGTADLASTPAPTGTYTVEYNPMIGYAEPPAQTQSVAEGATTSFAGTYTRQSGTLSVDVVPDTGGWRITSRPGDYTGALSGTGDLAASPAPTGNYRVEYDARAGYTTPGAQSLSLGAGGTAAFAGVYLRQSGTVTIDVTPESGSWTLTSHPADYAGPASGTGDLAATAAPTGVYTVRYNALAGYTEPAEQSLAVDNGTAVAFAGVYQRQAGRLAIDVNPGTGSWTITARPPDYTGPTSGTGDLPNTVAPTGVYAVQYGALTGYTTPAGQTLPVAQGQAVSFAGLYTRNVASLMIDMRPDTASWRITSRPADYTGPTSGTGDLAARPAPTGFYTVQYDPLAGYTAPASETLSVDVGATTAFVGSYVRQFGTISIDVTPEAGRWSLSAYPDDYTGPAGGVGDLAVTSAPAGAYTLACSAIEGYTPPAAQTRNVVDAQNTAFTALYTLNVYTISVNAGPNGTITPPGPVYVQHGSGTNFAVQAAADYRIREVLVNGAAVESAPNSVSFDYTFPAVTGACTFASSFNRVPVASLSAVPVEGIAPLIVTLDLSGSTDADGTIVRCEIDKDGDGLFERTVLGGAGAVAVQYAAAGSFTPTVRVIDDGGAWSEASAAVTVWGADATAVLEATPAAGIAPLNVTLAGTNSTGTAGRSIMVYEWDADGDGVYESISTRGVLSATYGQPGTHTAFLRVTDEFGVKAMDSATITVSPAPNPPEVTLNASPTNGLLPLAVAFYADVTDDGIVTTYRWDFDGDGHVDRITTEPAVTHTYERAGDFLARVTVVDADGLSDTDSIAVSACEPIQFTVWVSQPKDGGVLSGTEHTVHAQTAPGSVTVSVRFEYKLGSDTAWIPLTGEIYRQPSSFKILWSIAGLTDGAEYDVRAVGTATDGTVVASEPVRVTIDFSDEAELGKGTEGQQDGEHQKEETFDKDETTQVDVFDGTVVTIEAGTVDSNTTVKVALVGDNDKPNNGAAAGKTNVDANRDVSLEGDPELNKPIELIIPYKDVDNDGKVDGTSVSELTLRAYWYDEESGTWKRALDSEVFANENYVRAETYHLTEFGLFGSDSVLLPANGGVLASYTSEAGNLFAATYLTDENTLSYWRSETDPLREQGFVYTFTNEQSAIVSTAILHNHGEDAGPSLYSREFEILVSMNGVDYVLATNGTLAAGTGAQLFDLGSVTCRVVRLHIASGVSSQAWELAEFELTGVVTNDADADGLEDAWELYRFQRLDAMSGSDDPDADALSNAEEAALGTDPLSKDTDGDGRPDGLEARRGTDPTDPSSFPLGAPNDYDGDGKTDLCLYLPRSGTWYMLQSRDGFRACQFGWQGPIPVPADYDGDGKADVALYYPPSGTWYILQSQNGFRSQPFGWAQATAVPGDYDGDGRADLAVYGWEGTWYFLQSTDGFAIQPFGWYEPIPVPADYDGDGVTDLALFAERTGTWYLLQSSEGFRMKQFGWFGPAPVPADYDGDGRADFAVYSGVHGTWYLLMSHDGFEAREFGWAGPVAVPGDYDGDGKADIALYYPPSGSWYILQSSAGFRTLQFGWSEPIPTGAKW